jgi:energy-converting hydrogenase B subunit D
MTALQTVCLLAVAVTGTATVLTRDPLRQAVASAVFGLSLSVLFLAFGAPDVALSQIVVAGVAVPVMVLLALAKIRTDEKRSKREEEGEEA